MLKPCVLLSDSGLWEVLVLGQAILLLLGPRMENSFWDDLSVHDTILSCLSRALQLSWRHWKTFVPLILVSSQGGGGWPALGGHSVSESHAELSRNLKFSKERYNMKAELRVFVLC